VEEQIWNPEGNFDFEGGSLDFSCTKLELTLYKDEIAEGSFMVYGPEGRNSRGKIYTSDSRMYCFPDTFSGEEEEIAYTFDGRGMDEGDVLKGEIFFISDQGEFYLPFVATVSYHTLNSSLGIIKNLFHFTNLAKSSWAEAVKLFYSPGFSIVFSGSDRQYYQLYKGLSMYKGNERNMEEFLLAVNKKQKIDYKCSEDAVRIEDAAGFAEYHLTLTRNGWGYTSLEIGSADGLLLPEKERLTEDDFLGNHCDICFRLNEQKLHDGNNYDRLVIKASDRMIFVPVTVVNGGGSRHGGKRRMQRRHTVQLMEFYQAFRLKKISASTWLKETQKLIEQMITLDDKDAAARLFQAQLLISQERYNEAQWILDHTVQMMDRQPGGGEEPVLLAYRLYLTTLIGRNEAYTNEVAAEVEELYKQYGDWRIAWILLYLSEEYNKSGSRKWLFLEEQYRRGCTSPMLYIEALILIRMNPTLFMKLSGFELQILHYAARREALTGDMIEQLNCLVPREKGYSEVLFKVLEAAYKKKAERETLTAICSLLIKGGKTDSRYFGWYEKAVEAGVRLTRLYDYYMLSMDITKPAPVHKMVLMYFSYHSSLDYERNAYLYADVHRRRKDFPDLYLTYLPQIEKFVIEQISKRRMNKDIAFLYKYYINEQMINERSARDLANLLFMHQIHVEEKRFSRIIVRHPALKEEAEYGLNEGTGVIPLFGQDCTILFEDQEQYRFTGDGQYTMEKLMLPGKLLKMLNGYAEDETGLNLYLCGAGHENPEIHEENGKRFEALFASPLLEESCRKQIGTALAKYYYEQDRMEELDAFLEVLDLNGYDGKARSEFIHYFVLRGMYEKAYEWIRIYGTYGMDVKTMVRLFDYRISIQGMEEDKTLTDVAIYSFRRGKYNEGILNYLSSFYQGMTKELRDLWKADASFDVDTYYLSEKIIRQMLFTGSYVGEQIEIFKSYVKGGARTEVEDAFLSQCAYDYFVYDKIMDSYIFEEICRELAGENGLHPVCKFAVVKYYSDNPENVGKEQWPQLQAYINEMLFGQMHLSFLKKYADYVPAVRQLADMTIIEYHAARGARAYIHYVMEKDSGESGEYRTEEMKQVCGGICFKEFRLFFGEKIQYYIMEETDGSGQLTESAAIQKSDIEKETDNSRYNLVNDIAIAHSLQDYDTIDGLLEEYGRMSYMTDRLFGLR